MAGTSAARQVGSRTRPISFANLSCRQAFLDYAHAMVRLPQLRARLEQADSDERDGLFAELEELTRSVPKLIGVLADTLRDRSDARHNAAVAEMIEGLSMRLDQLRPQAVSGLVLLLLTALSHPPLPAPLAWNPAPYSQRR